MKHTIDNTVTVDNCIFCKIIKGEIPATLLYQDGDFAIIKDLHPRAPLHYLAIPKSHFVTMEDADYYQSQIVGRMLKKISTIKEQLDLVDYRLIVNQGKGAGQSVWHYHVHILGGKQFGDF
ncbi:MAG: HIT domain-containing protein [Firmicutes bacterium]|nr:HIT domain-containing protein [Bacillota bacterium]